MSVLIKGIAMPKSCWDCELFFCSLKDRLKHIEDRNPDCPLVEIPTPHGRLIDADALFEAMGLDTVKEVMLRNWKFTTAWGVPIIEAEEQDDI